MADKKQNRTCFTCTHRAVCGVMKSVMESTKAINVNIDGKDAPGQWVDIFVAVGNCCLHYKEQE